MINKTHVKYLLREGKSISEVAEEIGASTESVSRVKRIAGITNGTEQLVQHHVKYEELHGIDKIVLMTQSEHKKLHCRLRKEGKCNIPADELHKISGAAHKRTDKYKAPRKNYDKEYWQSDRGQNVKKIYRKNIYRKQFHKTIVKNIRLYEYIVYNLKTENVSYGSGFYGRYGIKLPVIDI